MKKSLLTYLLNREIDPLHVVQKKKGQHFFNMSFLFILNLLVLFVQQLKIWTY